jgi:hypothetical protein
VPNFMPVTSTLLKLLLADVYRYSCEPKVLIGTCLQLLAGNVPKGKKVKQSRYTPWRRLGGEEV